MPVPKNLNLRDRIVTIIIRHNAPRVIIIFTIYFSHIIENGDARALAQK